MRNSPRSCRRAFTRDILGSVAFDEETTPTYEWLVARWNDPRDLGRRVVREMPALVSAGIEWSPQRFFGTGISRDVAVRGRHEPETSSFFVLIDFRSKGKREPVPLRSHGRMVIPDVTACPLLVLPLGAMTFAGIEFLVPEGTELVYTLVALLRPPVEGVYVLNGFPGLLAGLGALEEIVPGEVGKTSPRAIFGVTKGRPEWKNEGGNLRVWCDKERLFSPEKDVSQPHEVSSPFSTRLRQLRLQNLSHLPQTKTFVDG